MSIKKKGGKILNYQRVSLEEVKNPQRFNDDKSFLDDAIKYATDKIFSVMKDFVHKFPSSSSENLIYKPFPDIYETDWVAGFWTGMLWTSYELTGNELFRAVAETQFDDYQEKYDDFTCFWHHDIGFTYIPSIVAQYKITGVKKAKELGVKAARALANRFSEKAGIIQVRNQSAQGEFIVDCSMNIPLLFWASHVTGERQFFVKALSHIYKVAECTINDNASVKQHGLIDEVTGEVLDYKKPNQGGAVCWARGQVWIMYGLALAYRYAKDERILEMAKRVSNYFLNRLPSDLICNWDLVLTADDDPRDSSNAPIAACALLEISKHLSENDVHKKMYEDAAISIMRNLSEQYTTKGRESNGLLMHGVYVKNSLGDDECCMWGDYFYMEGLLRLKNENWNIYW